MRKLIDNRFCFREKSRSDTGCAIVEIQGDYKLCERLHKFIATKVIAAKKLNSYDYACVNLLL